MITIKVNNPGIKVPHLISYKEEVDLSTLGVLLGEILKLIKSSNLRVIYSVIRCHYSNNCFICSFIIGIG